MDPCCKELCTGEQVPLLEEGMGVFPGVGGENHLEITLIAGIAQWGILVLGSVLKYSVLVENLRSSKVKQIERQLSLRK